MFTICDHTYLWEISVDEQSHAENLGVKVQGPLGVLDSEHDLLHHDLAHVLPRLHLGTVAVVGRHVELFGGHVVAATVVDHAGFSSDEGLNGRGISPRAPVLLLARLDVCYCFFVFKVKLRHFRVGFISTGL